jgi:hypothetical protein
MNAVTVKVAEPKTGPFANGITGPEQRLFYIHNASYIADMRPRVWLHNYWARFVSSKIWGQMVWGIRS